MRLSLKVSTISRDPGGATLRAAEATAATPDVDADAMRPRWPRIVKRSGAMWRM